MARKKKENEEIAQEVKKERKNTVKKAEPKDKAKKGKTNAQRNIPFKNKK